MFCFVLFYAPWGSLIFIHFLMVCHRQEIVHPLLRSDISHFLWSCTGQLSGPITFLLSSLTRQDNICYHSYTEDHCKLFKT